MPVAREQRLVVRLKVCGRDDLDVRVAEGRRVGAQVESDRHREQRRGVSCVVRLPAVLCRLRPGNEHKSEQTGDAILVYTSGNK